tara:strand:- start:1513 stop:1707 length:195 start_codon:yes stop_codon:yes gene_type:complete
MSNATTDLLNSIAAEMGTDKNETISIAIQMLVNEAGFSVRDAADQILGEGGYDRLTEAVLELGE